MPLHHIDGHPATLQEWIGVQVDTAKQWSLGSAEHLDSEQTIMCWVTLFAREVRELCDKHNVPLETFHDLFPQHENAVTSHIEEYKWFRSEQARGDIGLDTVIEKVCTDVHEVDVDGCIFVEVRTVVPSVDGDSKGAEIVTRFPKEQQEQAA